MQIHLKILSFALLTFFSVEVSRADVIVGLWHLGESDVPPPVNGNPADSSTVDSAGGDKLNLTGTGLTYTNNVAAPGSTFGVNFGGDGGYLGNPILIGPDNWGLSIWADPTSLPPGGGNADVIYDGATDTSGMGIYEFGSDWGILFGGIVGQTEAPVILDQWVQLTLIEENGVATFYVNGVPTGPTFIGLPNPINAGDKMQIGINQAGNEPFTGALDQGMVFTTTPEPSSIALTAFVALAAIRLRRRARA